MITFTLKAAAEIKKVLEEHGDEYNKNHFLRVGVQGGGCSGFSYSLTFEKNETLSEEKDTKYEDNEIKFIVDSKSMTLLKGTSIDYVTELNGRGFKFENPLATKSCGCGTSFDV